MNVHGKYTNDIDYESEVSDHNKLNNQRRARKRKILAFKGRNELRPATRGPAEEVFSVFSIPLAESGRCLRLATDFLPPP